MISKTGIQRVFLQVLVALMIMCNCINDPSNKGWEPEGDFIIKNNIPPIYKILCDKKGRFYGLTSECVIFFDKTNLDANSAPDTLPGSCNPRYIFFDRNQDLIVLQGYSAKRYRSGPTEIHAENLDNSLFMDNALKFVNMDSSVAMLTNWANQIVCWDGASFTRRGQIPDEYFYNISGIFLHENGLDVFVNSNYSINRILVNGSSYNVIRIASDSIIIDMITKKWHTVFGAGFINTGDSWTSVLFTVSTQDSLRVLDTISENAHEFIESDNAIYLRTSDYMYRITSGSIRKASISSNLYGPLFLDHNGRPAIFYQNTRRIIYIDSLGYYHERKW